MTLQFLCLCPKTETLKCKRRRVAFMSTLSAMAMTSAAFAQSTDIARDITLSELGFSGGVQFERLLGEQVIYVPIGVPDAVRSATLHLDLTYAATRDAERYIKISIDDEIVAVRGLDSASGTDILTIPVSVQAMADGFVKVKLSYSGAATDVVCIDDRAVGDFLRIADSSGIALTLDSSMLDQAAEVAAMMPLNVAVQASTDLDAQAFALRAATIRGGEVGAVVSAPETQSGPWELTSLSFSAGGDAVGVIGDGLPGLSFAGPAAQSTLAQLLDISPQITTEGYVALKTLGFDTTPVTFSGRHTFEIPFDRGMFASGLLPSQLDLSVFATPDTSGRGAAITVILNGEIVGGRTLRGGEAERFVVDLPETLIGRNNLIEVIVRREPLAGACIANDSGYPVQILPQSALLLTKTDQTIRTFDDLYQAFGSGAEVVAPLTADLDWAYAAVGAAVPDSANITVVENIAELTGTLPFVVIANTLPDGSSNKVAFDGSRVEVTDETGAVIYDSNALGQLAIAQIIELNGQSGLWLRPNTERPVTSQERPLTLGNGDIALINGLGNTLSLSTNAADIADLRFPDRRSYASVFEEYRGWIFGALWLALTIAVLAGLARFYRPKTDSSLDE